MQTTYLLGVLFLLICLSILIFFLNIKIDVNYLREDENDEIVVSLSLFKGFVRYKTVIGFLDIMHHGNNVISARIEEDTQIGKDEKQINDSKDKELSLNELEKMIEKVQFYKKRYWNTIQYIMERVIVNKIVWNTKIGLEDAAITAIATGLLWGIKSNIIQYAKRKIKIDKIYINVVPYYVSKKFVAAFHCIVTIKIGYIIIASLKFLIMKLRGGEKNERASN